MEDFSSDHEKNKEIIRQMDEQITMKASKYELNELDKQIYDG